MSNHRLLLLAAILFSGFATSCNKSDSPSIPPDGRLKVSFSNEADGKPIALGAMAYKNAAGNQYSVDLLKYYVTNFTLVNAAGEEKNFHNYNLINAADSASLSFTLDSVASGDYTAVKFYLGVDSLHNHTGAQTGALDPVNGMIWTWNTGYIFFKHEGFFKDSTGANKTLLFHYGNDASLCTITIPIPKLSVSGDTRKLYLTFNLNSLYASPSMIDFNHDNSHMSSSRDDAFWLSSMAGNFPKAFTYSKAE